jgi:xanthine/uracil permease
MVVGLLTAVIGVGLPVWSLRGSGRGQDRAVKGEFREPWMVWVFLGVFVVSIAVRILFTDWAPWAKVVSIIVGVAVVLLVYFWPLKKS